jgi:hypothetical protein
MTAALVATGTLQAVLFDLTTGLRMRNEENCDKK